MICRKRPDEKTRKNQIKQNKTTIELPLFYFVLSGFFLAFLKGAKRT
jgi:hypothetical protein